MKAITFAVFVMFLAGHHGSCAAGAKRQFHEDSGDHANSRH